MPCGLSVLAGTSSVGARFGFSSDDLPTSGGCYASNWCVFTHVPPACTLRVCSTANIHTQLQLSE